MAAHGKNFHRDDGFTQPYTFSEGEAFARVDVLRIQTLCAPLKSVDGSGSEPERSIHVKGRATVGTIKGATDAIRRFAGAQAPVINALVQI